MNIQFKNFDGGIKPPLENRIERKLTKLAKLTDTKEHTANVSFEMDRAVGSRQTGEVWQATINVDVNGTRYHTSELAETPEKASAKALKEIQIELKKARGKRQAKVKREGSFWKDFHARFTAGRRERGNVPL
jgi:ribosome-associated translation inhibitor RaiA